MFENPERQNSKEAKEKPPILYHGTITPNITEFEPRKRYTPGDKRDIQPRIYATSNPAFAAAHSFPWHSGEGVNLSIITGKVHLEVPESLKSRLDQKVYIYSLDSRNFSFTEEDTLGETFHSENSEEPIHIESFDSVTEAVEYFGGSIEIVPD